MAVQICTVRYVGRFLGEDPLAVPWEVVEYLAGQLGIADASCVKRYAERRGRRRRGVTGGAPGNGQGPRAPGMG
ncbi:hypothetical protein GCM10010294_28220 [Streptomyces griseoloalbus]|nr:hypothetical protein GCM10010294_28220 [Streptomyces griseoloalbus]